MISDWSNDKGGVLVLHEGALRDALLSLPCFNAISSDGGRIHLVGRGEIVRFLRDSGVVHEASSSDGAMCTLLYSDAGDRLRSTLAGFGRAFIFSVTAVPPAAEAIGSIIRDTRVIRTIPPAGSHIHAAAYRLEQVLGRAGEIPMASVVLPAAQIHASERRLTDAGRKSGQRVIAVHPGSGGRAKCWSWERFAWIIERLLTGSNAFLVLFTGEADAGELQDRAGGFASDRSTVFHAAGLDLMSAASILSHSELYLGNDSGFSHLAGLLGVPSLVLFGPTDASVWRPLGPRVEVISADGPGEMAAIPVEVVLARLIAGGWSR